MPKNYNAWPDQWPKTLNYPEQPVYSFLDHTAARVPNRLAVVFGGMELTYSENAIDIPHLVVNSILHFVNWHIVSPPKVHFA